MTDIAQLQSSLRVAFSKGINSFTGLCFGMSFLISSNLQVASFLGLIFPFATVGANLMGSFLRRLSKEINQQSAKLSTSSQESLSMVRTVKSFNGEQQEIDKFGAELKELESKKRKLAVYAGIFYAGMNLGLNLLGFVVVGILMLSVQDGHLTKGDVFGLLGEVRKATGYLTQLSLVFSQLSKSLKSSERIFELLAQNPQISKYGIQRQESKLNRESNLLIQFENVHFRYPTRDDVPVLQGLDLEVKRGETVALVGSSGSGKSTIFSLIQRFYLPEQGKIFLNGKEIDKFSNKELSKQVSIVSQEPDLFSRSILKNIKYGEKAATDADVRLAAQQANAIDFVSDFPDGFETHLGERGALLSGGQKQRIAIARSLLVNSDILLLDEATSALDNQSEKQVQSALEKIMNDGKRDKAVVVIAHRLSTVVNADRIVVIEKGRKIEEGSHFELMKKKGKYFELFNAQFH
eukprot:snap_masked-scaffold_42-processed-gene-2.32-mRNA-1 protein AED:0.15 eAED:0.15 QI:0/0/0/1/1/1/2/0/463